MRLGVVQLIDLRDLGVEWLAGFRYSRLQRCVGSLVVDSHGYKRPESGSENNLGQQGAVFVRGSAELTVVALAARPLCFPIRTV